MIQNTVQGSENVFCKGPDSKYISLCRPYGFSRNCCYAMTKAVTDSMYMNEHSLYTNKTLWISKLKCQYNFPKSQNILFYFFL